MLTVRCDQLNLVKFRRRMQLLCTFQWTKPSKNVKNHGFRCCMANFWTNVDIFSHFMIKSILVVPMIPHLLPLVTDFGNGNFLHILIHQWD